MSVFGNNLFSQFNDSDSEDNLDDVIDLKEFDRCRKENEDLKIENANLRKALRIIAQPHKVKIRDPNRDGPTAQLLLYNNVFSRHEKDSLEDLLRHYLYRPKQINDITIQPQHSALQCPSPAHSRRRLGVDAAFVITNSIQFYSSQFCIDQLGEPIKRNNESFSKIPGYDRGSADVLDGEVVIEEAKEGRAMRTCFNCGQKDHQLKDCPVPKNFKAIKDRKQKFLNVMSNSPQGGTQRYHADQDDDVTDPRFASFKPGVISQALRDALGITERELPPYIYQMRMLGYPPGHLEEARVRKSGLSFYKGEDEKRNCDSDSEGGPVDVEMLIDFPGFNVAPDQHVVDDHDRQGRMPMDQRHSKEMMVSYHNHMNALLSKRKAETSEKEEHTRKRHKPNHVIKSKNDDVREVDMETSDAEGENLDAINVEANEGNPPDSGAGHLVKVEEVVTKDHDDVGRDESRMKDVDSDVIISETEQEYTIEEIVEEGEIATSSGDDVIEEQTSDDGFEIGNMGEEALEVRREAILKELGMAGSDDSSDVIYVSSEVDLTLDDAREEGKAPVSVGKPEARNPGDVIELSDETSDENVIPSQNMEPAPAVDSPQNMEPAPAVDSPQSMEPAPAVDSPQSMEPAPAVDSPQSMEPAPAVDSPQSMEPAPAVDSPQSMEPAPAVDSPQNMEPAPAVDSPQNMEPAPAVDSPKIDSPQNMKSVTGADPGGERGVNDITPMWSPTNNPPHVHATAATIATSHTPSDSPKSPAMGKEGESPKRAEGGLAGNLPEGGGVLEESFSHVDPPFAQNKRCESPPVKVDDDSPESPPNDKLRSPTKAEFALQGSPHETSPEPRSPCDDSPQTSLPHRSRFAEGITQFDTYFRETKSSGVYKKLKNVLKGSPKNRSKPS